MKKLALSIAMMFCLVTSVVFAADPAVKIGVIDMQKILREAPQMAKIKANLKKKFDSREKKLTSARDELTKNAKKLQRDGSVMSEKDRKKLEKTVVSQQQDLRKDQMKFEQDLGKAQNEALQDFIEDVQDASEKIAKRGKYTLLVTKSSAVYSLGAMDLTSQLLKALK